MGHVRRRHRRHRNHAVTIVRVVRVVKPIETKKVIDRKRFFTGRRIRRFLVYGTLITIALGIELGKRESGHDLPVHEVALNFFMHIAPEWSTGAIGLAIFEFIAHTLGGE